MTHAGYIYTAYALSLAAVAGLTARAWASMRRAEREAAR